MPTPSTRTPVRIARGSYSNLNGSISDLQDGEISYAEDQNKLYIKEGSALVVLTQSAANPVFTGNATFDTNTLFVDGTNNRVGIGLTAPEESLHLKTSSGNCKLRIDAAATPAIEFYEAGTRNSDIMVDHSNNELIITNRQNASINFRTNGANERVRIDSSGRLLVGVTSSSSVYGLHHQLQVEGTNGATSSISLTRNSNSASPPYLTFGKTRGTSDGSNTIVQDGDALGTISFNGADGTNKDHMAAQITGAIDGTPGENDLPGRLVFKTTADGANSSTERMRIDSSGRLLLNTTTEGNAGADDLTIGQISGSTGITIRSGTTNNGNLYFSDGTSGDDEYRGSLQYQHNNNSLVIATNATTALTLDSSQNATFAGSVTATSFSGDGSALTGIETGGDPVRQAQHTSSASYTVPSGVTKIRAYAVGAGGDGGNNKQQTTGTYHQTSGAGGGMAYGDFTVSPGQTVTITISNRIATVSYGGTTLLTANPGAHATDGGTNNAAGGTATKHSSVTNGGAYSGGVGGYLATAGTACGGSSAGSPLGNGSKAAKGGGAGIGAGGGIWNSYGGGGAGSGGTGSGTDYVSGGSGPDCKGRDGARYALYTDPLLKNCVMPGEPGHIGYTVSPPHYYYSECPTGVGGWIAQSISPYSFWTAGNGGSFAGGGSNGINVSASHPNAAGDGGILAGGGSAGGNSGDYWPGHGGYGGGGGAGQTTSGTISQRGLGGSAVVWIFHT